MSMTSKEQSDALDAWLGPRGWSKQKSIYPSGFIDYASKDTDMIWIGWAAAHEELCAVHTAQIDELKKELTTRNAELEVEVARLNAALEASRLANREPYIDQLEADVARLEADSEYMQWIADNAEIATTGEGMRVVMALNVFGNNNLSLRDYLSMEINGSLHDIARNALKESGL